MGTTAVGQAGYSRSSWSGYGDTSMTGSGGGYQGGATAGTDPWYED